MVRGVQAGGLFRAGILPAAVFLVFAAALEAAEKPGQRTEGDLARQILEATGMKGGLIVHLGCGDGRLTAAFHASESYLVQGLETDAEEVRQAREYIRRLGNYGPVSVARFDGKRLPYADNLVNLLVAEDPGGVPTGEAIRVLAPGGAMYVKQDGRWRKTVKPRPKDVDEWTHYLHDASGNAVAHDRVVGPPRYVQWVEAPRHARSHEHTPSINALVSTGGRIFYIADQGPIASLRQPARWQLVARDAYNGILLWERPITAWCPHLCGWTQGPLQIQRKLVAVGSRVYVTLGLHAPLSAVDAASGETLEVYDETAGTEEIVCHNGILLLAVRSVTDERIAELAKWARLARQKESPLHARETTQPLVTRFRTIEAQAEVAVVALEAESGRLLWKKTGPDAAGLRPLTLSATGDRAFFQKRKDVVCLDLRTGQERWSVASDPLRVVCESSVVCADGQTVTTLSAGTGEVLWTQPASLCQIRDVFVINGSLWVGGFKPYSTGSSKHTGPVWGPYFATQRDLATGKILEQIEPQGPGHHHRCYRNKATERYILGGRRGVEYLDLKTGDVLWHSWVRGVCRYGVMPCNGLLYAPPHACGCYIAAKLSGFYALAGDTGSEVHGSGPPVRIGAETGGARFYRARHVGNVPHNQDATVIDSPILGTPDAGRLERGDDWPTYRHDAGRSGSTPSPVPALLDRRWQADLGGKLSSPTVSEGKVFVASVDEHTVRAVDADSGAPIWHFTADARVDSPPTLHRDRAIFGCRDGYVYSVRKSDGVLAWRRQAARRQRHVTACGQLESASPVHGSVLVDDGAVYCTAGRSSYLDGGIDLCRIQPDTGETLSRTPIYSPDPQTGKQPPQHGPASMPGALADVLTADEQYVYLRQMVFDKHGDSQAQGKPHLLTLTGFLDDSWPHRSYWIFGTRCSLATGCSGRDRNLVFGRLLVFDGSMIYGYGRANVHWSNQLQDGAYRLFARKRGEGTTAWAKPLPIRVRAMVLADKVLFVAGPPAEADQRPEESQPDQAALLMAISASDGAELARCRLDDSPVFDGMAAAGGRLYIALENGRLVCMGEKETTRGPETRNPITTQPSGSRSRQTLEIAPIGAERGQILANSATNRPSRQTAEILRNP